MKIIDTSKVLQSHPEIEYRIKVITFYSKYGLTPTKEAFNVSRSSIYLWKKKLKDAQGKLISLRNLSRRPHTVRRMYIEPLVLQFIKDLRIKYPRLSKDKMKPLLDEYCRANQLETLSCSTIGKVIARNCYFFYLKPKKSKGKPKKRLFGYEVKDVGDLSQIDSIAKFQNGIKRYIFTGIDTTGRFAFAYAYKTLSSQRGADFTAKYNEVSPYAIKAIQTDNGLEFAKDADQAMMERGIVHFYTYPKSPKMNAYIERFNRTLQEEFIDHHEGFLFDTDLNVFNSALMDYLLFYNTKRIHLGLNSQTPMDYIIKKSNMCGTDTLSCPFTRFKVVFWYARGKTRTRQNLRPLQGGRNI